jgi:hypothetical protein
MRWPPAASSSRPPEPPAPTWVTSPSTGILADQPISERTSGMVRSAPLDHAEWRYGLLAFLVGKVLDRQIGQTKL